RAAEKFAEHRAERDPAVFDEDGCSRLRNAAPARVGKEPVEQVTGRQRAERRYHDPAPRRLAAWRIHVRGEAPRKEDERDDRESDERPDEETERERQAVFAPAKILDELEQARVPRA